ncbi:GntR family transcriptional regulator [Peribacillus frigoritolerans]|uniref:GntR family transcriptional regulator n=1 Tax=Peribacillus frigoritolerans TaxID=450367 RepID=UPI002867CB3C|nr:GntR family transcriptional regulator [Peribacillus frigoritolerans]
MFGNASNLTDGIYFGESLPQQIAKHILKKIIEGEIEAGEKIVEEDISKELNTSRAPVREALYLLQVDGIVERMPRRGTIVNFQQSNGHQYQRCILWYEIHSANHERTRVRGSGERGFRRWNSCCA